MLQGCLGFQWKSLLSNLCKLVSLLPQFFFDSVEKKITEKAPLWPKMYFEYYFCLTVKGDFLLLLEICLFAGKEITFSGRCQLSQASTWRAAWMVSALRRRRGIGGGGDKRRQNGTCCPNVASVQLFNAWTEEGKEMTKAFLLLSSSLLMLFILTLKSKVKKSPLPPLQQGDHVSTAAPSLSWLAVWMSAVFVMTRVQSGGKLEPRRTGNWQIVFCPARIIISNTQRLHAQRTSAANGVTRNLKDTPFITPASPNFTLSGILSDTRLESAVSNRHQTCAVFFFLFFFDCVLSRRWCITAQKMQMKFSLQLQWENTRHLKGIKFP